MTPMKNEIAATEWKREYCGTDDFKSTPVRIFKVEAGLSSTYDLQAAARGVENNNVKEELREAAVPLSKTSIVMGQQEAEVGIRGTATIKCEPSWGTVRSPIRENQLDGLKEHSETDLMNHIRKLSVQYQNPAVFVQEFLRISQQPDEGV